MEGLIELKITIVQFNLGTNVSGFLQVCREDFSFIELSFIALTDSVNSSLYTVGITGAYRPF